MDEGETPEQAAVRELKEETGYVGVVSDVTPVMFNGSFASWFALLYVWILCRGNFGLGLLLMIWGIDPGFCNTNLRMIHVTIDLSLPENQNPKPELEENEFIEVFTIPLKDFYPELKKLEEQGYAMDARVATIAEGFELAKRWKL